VNQIVGRKSDGTPFLLLCLEPGNLHRLQQNRPIEIQVHSLFPDGVPKRLELVILYSDTPIRDAQDLAALANITVDERSFVAKTIRPHCPECHSTIEQFGAMRNKTPVALLFCAHCGCALGVVPKSLIDEVVPPPPDETTTEEAAL